MNSKKIKNILSDHKLSPNKKFGQNFLCNNNILDKIISSAEITIDDIILEIGPGLGCLTERLLSAGKKVIAVEIDKGLYNFIKKKFVADKKINIINKDFLKTDITDKIDKVIANLPYNCASQILFKCAVQIKPALILVMLQKEMAERIIAAPGTKNYGALTVTLNYFFSSVILFNVDKKSFYPQPDIISSVIKLNNRNRNIFNANEFKLFNNIVKSAFWGRRKTLVRALSDSPYLNYDKNLIIEYLKKTKIPCNLRGEMLSTDNFINLTRMIYNEL